VRGEFAEAQQRLRASVQPAFAGANNHAALAYLGAISAASGKDEEAVSIWQTALTVGAAQPDVYEWIGQAMMRLGRVPQARTAFAEGAAKFPGDPRFNRSLAFIYAHLGQSRDALQAMAGYLAQRQNDLDMLRLGVEWVYRAHEVGSAASDQERALVHRWVDIYEQAKGPNLEELKGWLRIIDGDNAPPAVPSSRI
jgi:tetratricopeptide (TPR) repeat protein